ncbi:MAG: hypothetical protein U9P38_00120 [Campylobacterota bacterium]|nr:hypothetical protein [Campylobacterota bacterium]
MKKVIFSVGIFLLFVGCGSSEGSAKSDIYDEKSTIKKVDGVPPFPEAPRD